RAASSREVPSRIIAIASSRRALAASSLFAAEARSSLGVWSMRVMTTAALTRSSNAANRRFKGSESYFRGFENRGGGESSSVAVGITSHFHAARLGPRPAFSGSCADQFALELCQAAEHGEHQPPVRGRDVGPCVAQGSETGLL